LPNVVAWAKVNGIVDLGRLTMHKLVAAFAALTLSFTLTAVTGPASYADSAHARITLTRWTDGHDFRTGTLDGLRVRGGRLVLDRHGSLPTLSYTDPFGNGTARRYAYGTWTSPTVTLGYPDDESISSWNARTPTGTWVETEFRGRHADGTWTKWYVMGRWTSGMDFADGDIHRTSVDGQGDADGTVYTDTFSSRTGREPLAFQTRVTLLRPTGTRVTPTLDAIATMTSEPHQDYSGTSAFTLGHHLELAVPAYAQNIHAGEYPEFGGGGEVWCSPTSTSMVMRYYGRHHSPSRHQLRGIDAPNGDPQVDYAAMHVWDYTYDGAGNWPFNAAYAHTYHLDSFVTRLRSLQEVERFIRAGIPVVVSASWTLDQMPEAGYETDGHLLTIVGFTADGDPIINDPASNSDANVRSIYTREHFEKVWQDSTGGVAYIYYRPGMHLPHHVAGLTRNW
jgi:hypothetical protein